jgi:nitrate reductase NapAB chaperone NapD
VPGKNQQVEFYTSDLSGDFVVVIQGLNKKGIAGSASTTFTVKKTDY